MRVTGIVELARGGAPSVPAEIILTCIGGSRRVGLSRKNGAFDFVFDPQVGRGGICRVSAHVSGMESSKASIPSLYGTEETVSVGRIILSDDGPGVVSITSAGAPKEARKHLRRARKMLERSEPDFETAAAELGAAVAAYPKYAEAWIELGGALAELDRRVDALDAYGKAIEADRLFVSVYRPAILYAVRAEALDLAHLWCEEGVRVDPGLKDACEAVE